MNNYKTSRQMRRARTREIRKSLGKYKEVYKSTESKDDLLLELSILYIANFPNQWVDSDDILIFQKIISEDYDLYIDQDELLALFIQVTEELLKED